jgi:hypothetical protein
MCPAPFSVGLGRPSSPIRRFRAPRGPRIPCPAEHETSRNGGRAVHGIVPSAFEFRWAQCRVGHSREWPSGTARHSHQEGRRDAWRWPRLTEGDERLSPPQGGEPEGRRDERRNVTAGRCTEGPSPVPPRAPNPSEPMIHVPGTFLIACARNPRSSRSSLECGLAGRMMRRPIGLNGSCRPSIRMDDWSPPIRTSRFTGVGFK